MKKYSVSFRADIELEFTVFATNDEEAQIFATDKLERFIDENKHLLISNWNCDCVEELK